MKKVFIALMALMVSTGVATAQKIGYLNTQTILNELPEYVSAQQTLEKLGNQYRSYLEQEAAKLESMFVAYQGEKARLSEAERQVRENEIVLFEKNLQDKQKEYFGEEGVMAAKSEQLMAPIKGKVDAAIAKVAQKGGYTLIIDISAVQGIVYRNQTDDLSMEVVRNL